MGSHRHAYDGGVSRWRILDELVAIPAMFNTPVVYGCVEWASIAKQHPGMSPKQFTCNANVIAFVTCAFVLENYMRQRAEEDDVVVVVMENNEQMRRPLKSIQQFARDPRNTDALTRFDPGRRYTSRKRARRARCKSQTSAPL